MTGKSDDRCIQNVKSLLEINCLVNYTLSSLMHKMLIARATHSFVNIQLGFNIGNGIKKNVTFLMRLHLRFQGMYVVILRSYAYQEMLLLPKITILLHCFMFRFLTVQMEPQFHVVPIYNYISFVLT